MEQHSHDDDLNRIKELLRHTGEFIAYFELAETKMLDWRIEIEQQAARLGQQAHTLHNELSSVSELLSEAGTSRFRVLAEKALSQGEMHLHLLERKCEQLTLNVQQHQERLSSLTENCLEKIDKHVTQATQNIANQLSKYDVHQFNRIASESCDHVEQAAQDAIYKSHKLLNNFHWKSSFFAIVLTVLTTFIIVLYLSDELPWEIHEQAMNERQAGKVLLQAWPNLSQEEKTKILNDERFKNG